MMTITKTVPELERALAQCLAASSWWTRPLWRRPGSARQLAKPCFLGKPHIHRWRDDGAGP